jgi:galactonate dehydratase
MKISAIRTVVVHARMRNWVFVKVETDEGLVGWGEASLEWKTRAVVAAVEDLAPFVLGVDPRRIEHIWQVLYRQPFFRGGPVALSALSGIEQACWDILGKSLGAPLYQLLGGKVRDKVRVYDHLGGGTTEAVYLTSEPERFAELALASVAQGFSAVKVLLVPRSYPLEGRKALLHVERTMTKLRDAVGDEVDVMVDFHGRTTPAQAIRYARVLEPFSPLFIEEPVLPENVPALERVSRAVTVPVAAGERLVTRFGFRELCERQAVAVVQPDLCHCGGVGEARKIASMAETYYLAVAPHNPLGPIATAVAVHFGQAVPNFLILEAMRQDVPWRDEVVRDPVTVVDGFAVAPDKPGIGVEVDERAAARHPFQQEEIERYFHDDGSVADW